MTEKEKDIALRGGKTVPVTLTRTPWQMEVKVRHVPLSEVPRLFELLDDEAKLIDFATQSPGIADTLDLDSVDAVLEAIVEVNRPTLARRIERRTRLLRALVPAPSPGEEPKNPPATSPISQPMPPSPLPGSA